jgi:nicotinate-nucleotide pyrophosphorylase (carboxylating)
MDEQKLREIIERALEEDIGQGDVTSMWVLPPNSIARAKIVAREPGIAAGLLAAEKVFGQVNPLIAFTLLREDGEAVEAGDELATVVGPATSVFTAERTALSILSHMSGIATRTRLYVDAVRGTNAVILGSRKAVPCPRAIDQWAVQLGGGGSDLNRLSDVVFIRSGHATIAGGLPAAVERARQANTGLQILVEAQNWEQLDEALPLEPDRIVLTELPIDDIADAVKWVAGRVPLEISGDIPLENARAIAETGVDYISVDSLVQYVRPMHTTLETEVPSQ